MNYQDKISRTISQFIYSQLPATVHLDFEKPLTGKTDRTLFTRFLELYYEFLEQNVLVSLTDKSNNSIQLLQSDMIGEVKREVVPGLHGELMRLPGYRDIDLTKETLKSNLYNEYLNNYTQDMLGSKERFLKISNDINRAKGTELSFEILFRFIYNESAKFIEPAKEIFRVSSNNYFGETIMRIKEIPSDIEPSKLENFSEFKDKYIYGKTSGARAYVLKFDHESNLRIKETAPVLSISLLSGGTGYKIPGSIGTAETSLLLTGPSDTGYSAGGVLDLALISAGSGYSPFLRLELFENSESGWANGDHLLAMSDFDDLKNSHSFLGWNINKGIGKIISNDVVDGKTFYNVETQDPEDIMPGAEYWSHGIPEFTPSKVSVPVDLVVPIDDTFNKIPVSYDSATGGHNAFCYQGTIETKTANGIIKFYSDVRRFDLGVSSVASLYNKTQKLVLGKKTLLFNGVTAVNSNIITYTAHGLDDDTLVVYTNDNNTKYFNGLDDIDTGTEEITITGHGFTTGTPVVYKSGATVVTNLVNGTTYYVIKVDNNILKLADSVANANAGTARNIVGPGSDDRHFLSGIDIGGLTSGNTYYMVRLNANTFSLSATVGGSVITLTDGWSGNHSLTGDIPSVTPGFTVGGIVEQPGETAGGSVDAKGKILSWDINTGVMWVELLANANGIETYFNPEKSIEQYEAGTNGLLWTNTANAIVDPSAGEIVEVEPYTIVTVGDGDGNDYVIGEVVKQEDTTIGTAEGTVFKWDASLKKVWLVRVNGTFDISSIPLVGANTTTRPVINYDNVKKHTTGIVDDFGTSIKTFNGATNVDSNVISITGHGFTTGTPVVYKSGATVVTNLISGNLYYVIYLTDGTLSLSLTASGSAITLADGSSDTHSLTYNSITIKDMKTNNFGAWFEVGLPLIIRGSDGPFDYTQCVIRSISLDSVTQYVKANIDVLDGHFVDTVENSSGDAIKFYSINSAGGHVDSGISTWELKNIYHQVVDAGLVGKSVVKNITHTGIKKDVTTTYGTGTGLTVKYTTDSTTSLVSATIVAPGTGYLVGDKVYVLSKTGVEYQDSGNPRAGISGNNGLITVTGVDSFGEVTSVASKTTVETTFGLIGSNLEGDINGDGVVDIYDLVLATRDAGSGYTSDGTTAVDTTYGNGSGLEVNYSIRRKDKIHEIDVDTIAVSAAGSKYELNEEVYALHDFNTKIFNGETAVDSNIITITDHGFTTGTPVVYESGATVVTNLTSGNTYYVIYLTVDTFSLSLTASGSAITLADGSDDNHSLTNYSLGGVEVKLDDVTDASELILILEGTGSNHTLASGSLGDIVRQITGYGSTITYASGTISGLGEKKVVLENVTGIFSNDPTHKFKVGGSAVDWRVRRIEMFDPDSTITFPGAITAKVVSQDHTTKSVVVSNISNLGTGFAVDGSAISTIADIDYPTAAEIVADPAVNPIPTFKVKSIGNYQVANSKNGTKIKVSKLAATTSTGVALHGGSGSAATVSYTTNDRGVVDSFTLDANSIGSIVATTVGSGYSAGSLTFNNTGTNGSNAAGTYTVDGSGGIDEITITNIGSGYTKAPVVTGTGTGTNAVFVVTLGAGKDYKVGDELTIKSDNILPVTLAGGNATKLKIDKIQATGIAAMTHFKESTGKVNETASGLTLDYVVDSSAVVTSVTINTPGDGYKEDIGSTTETVYLIPTLDDARDSGYGGTSTDAVISIIDTDNISLAESAELSLRDDIDGKFRTNEVIVAQDVDGNDINISNSTNLLRAEVDPVIDGVNVTHGGIGYRVGDEAAKLDKSGIGGRVAVESVSSGPVESLILDSDGANHGKAISINSKLGFSTRYIDVYGFASTKTGSLTSYDDIESTFSVDTAAWSNDVEDEWPTGDVFSNFDKLAILKGSITGTTIRVVKFENISPNLWRLWLFDGDQWDKLSLGKNYTGERFDLSYSYHPTNGTFWAGFILNGDISNNEGWVESELGYTGASGELFAKPVATCYGSEIKMIGPRGPQAVIETFNQINSVSVTVQGSGYPDSGDLVFSGGGTPITPATGTFTATDGAIDFGGIVITNKGNGYSSTPTVTATGSSNATLIVQLDNGINSIELLDGGAGYSDFPLVYAYNPSTGYGNEVDNTAILYSYGSKIGSITSVKVANHGTSYSGTELSFDAKTVPGGNAGIGYPDPTAKGTLITNPVYRSKMRPIDNIGVPDGTQRLPDKEVYNDFSYVLESSVSPAVYKDMLKKTVHPVGFRTNPKYVYASKPDSHTKSILTVVDTNASYDNKQETT